MTTLAEKLKSEALDLPQSDRAELARVLIESLDEDGETLTEEEWEAAWAPELERRMQEIEEGKDAGEPAEKVFAELRAELRTLRAQRS